MTKRLYFLKNNTGKTLFYDHAGLTYEVPQGESEVPESRAQFALTKLQGAGVALEERLIKSAQGPVEDAPSAEAV